MDEDGKPVIGINVDAARPSGSGKVTSTTTGADGGYAFKELPPAEYLLNTRPGRFTTGEGFLHWAPTTVPPPPVKGQARAWRTEYYPGGSDLSQAEKIVLRPGASLQGYDLRLRAVPAHPYEGRVVDEKGDPVAATVLWYEGRLGVAEHLTEAGPDGRFRVPAVREGEWKVVALRAKGASPAAAFLQVTVSGPQGKPVELRLEPPFTLEGSVKIPAAAGPEVRKQIGLFLRAVNTVSYKTVLSSMDASGRLELPGVYRGRYEVRTGDVEGAYPVSVRQGGREVLGQTVELYPGAPPFEAEYRTATARIEGVVEKCPGCRVHAIPTDPMHLLIRGPRLTSCDADGRFRIGAVAEGSYRVLAFDVAPGGMTPHFDDRFQGGSAVSLKDGESATLELRVSPWPLPLF